MELSYKWTRAKKTLENSTVPLYTNINSRGYRMKHDVEINLVFALLFTERHTEKKKDTNEADH